MQEFLWEVWTGKRNMHHRIQMAMNETPEVAFRRLAAELQGTEKEISMRALDPNTGKEVDVQWRFSCRNKGEESPLGGKQAFSAQGVQEGALIVVRPVELRARTLYIDGFDGLGEEEIAVASSKRSIMGFVVAAILVLGGIGGYVFYSSGQKGFETYSIEINTGPKDSDFEIIADMTGLPGFGDNKIVRLSNKTPRRFALRRAAKIIRIAISQKGYKTWTKGISENEWKKLTPAKQKEIAIEPRQLMIKGFFPKMLEVAPKEPPKPPAAAPSRPESVKVNYPGRRWLRKIRKFRLALDPDHGGDDKGAVGITTQKTASQLNLEMASAIAKHLGRQRAFRRKVGFTRKADKAISMDARIKNARKRSKLLLQIDVADGLKEQPKWASKETVGGKEVSYNDALAGYKVVYSDQNKAAAASEKFAKCLGDAMKLAGFLPNASAKATLAGSSNGVHKMSMPLLDGSPIPAVRLVVGYLTHRAEEKVLTNADNHAPLASAVEHALVCYLK
ncbi:MAG: N-acetylmuramoyl-L-alanine amidase [Myxococcales bacterium]|nr:N-acetylmuramoyl-L-alanine amidase [Myxococcales bacterium]MCB9644276.1 N-acetylmuramoyl-L-alanine amidase [Myxococcales bacterium]